MPSTSHRESNTPHQDACAGTSSSRRLRLAKSVIALALVCASCESLAQPAPADVSLEYAVKATYLCKLAPFVNWPPQTFMAANVPFRICVVGEDPFDDFLEKSVAGQRFGTHPFEIQHMQALTPDAQCQIVFVSHLQSQSLDDLLSSVAGKPVLTVTDSTAPGGSGSIVQFVVENGRVRFDINTGAAARNHLTISSKLLNLALAVNG